RQLRGALGAHRRALLGALLVRALPRPLIEALLVEAQPRALIGARGKALLVGALPRALIALRDRRAALAAEHHRPLPLGTAGRAFGLWTGHAGSLSSAPTGAVRTHDIANCVPDQAVSLAVRHPLPFPQRSVGTVAVMPVSSCLRPAIAVA